MVVGGGGNKSAVNTSIWMLCGHCKHLSVCSSIDSNPKNHLHVAANQLCFCLVAICALGSRTGCSLLNKPHLYCSLQLLL